ncbi:MAG: ATP-binding protein, partial [Lachnospiraceae bacterium]|nr:ATP-binding protein [Lachnospiraceae bacterium]
LDGRSVELELKQQQGMLLISCKNPYAGERRGDNGKFASTKEEKSGHGIGLSSVRQVCKKYQGTMEISAENQEFQVHLLLMEKQ